ncbi:MAG: DUF692 domain-containing protein [Myxococcales bacterium]|nr:DUF692 domain-containing protein [Myxococcales bacterium]
MMKRRAEGVGIGFRMRMAEELLEALPSEVRWLEIHPENYIRRGGRYRTMLARAREHWPIVTHGLTTGFGSASPHDPAYLEELGAFLSEVEAPWHSDHACFAGAHGAFVHDLLPVPFTDEAASTMVARVQELRDATQVPIAIENVSYYAPQGENPLEEIAFLREVLERADAKLMLDVNNVYVNSQNFGFDPKAWIDQVPPGRVIQMHVAGHWLREDGLRIDTHGAPICEEVYALLEHTLAHVGPVPVLLERDNEIPPLSELLGEVRRLQEIYDRAIRVAAPSPEAGA